MGPRNAAECCVPRRVRRETPAQSRSRAKGRPLPCPPLSKGEGSRSNSFRHPFFRSDGGEGRGEGATGKRNRSQPAQNRRQKHARRQQRRPQRLLRRRVVRQGRDNRSQQKSEAQHGGRRRQQKTPHADACLLGRLALPCCPPPVDDANPCPQPQPAPHDLFSQGPRGRVPLRVQQKPRAVKLPDHGVGVFIRRTANRVRHRRAGKIGHVPARVSGPASRCPRPRSTYKTPRPRRQPSASTPAAAASRTPKPSPRPGRLRGQSPA